MTEADPDWDLLARDPVAFFELAEGWDRRDLRRAYGRWIKRFKPDAHPDEFRRIRAGFERLEDDLRFQRLKDDAEEPETRPAKRTSRPSSSRPETPSAEEPLPTDEVDRRPEQARLIASIAERGPAAVLRELRLDFPHWWVPGYLSLFLVGDEAASDAAFERQLMAALLDSPRDPVLLNLMRSWVRMRGSAGGDVELLETLRGLPDMTLAVVATPLLRDLAATGQGEVLAGELMRLERSVHQEGRAAFAAVLEDCLLVAAMVLDVELVDGWLDEIAIDRHGRFDVDDAHAEAASRILTWRRERAAQESKGRKQSALLRELEAALLELAAGDEATRIDVLIAVGQRLRCSDAEIYNQCKPYDRTSLALGEALSLFGIPAEEGPQLSEAEHVSALRSTQAFLKEMNGRTENSVIGRLWALLPVMAGTVSALVLALLLSPLTATFEALQPGVDAAPVATVEAARDVAASAGATAGEGASDRDGPLFGWLAPLISLGLLLLVQFVRRERRDPLWVVSRILRRAEHNLSLFLYRRIWRRKLTEFAALQPWGGRQLVSVLTALQESDGSTAAEQITVHLAEDPALVLTLIGRDLEP